MCLSFIQYFRRIMRSLNLIFILRAGTLPERVFSWMNAFVWQQAFETYPQFVFAEVFKKQQTNKNIIEFNPALPRIEPIMQMV